MGETWGPINSSIGTIYVMGNNEDERNKYLEKLETRFGLFICNESIGYGSLKGKYSFFPFDHFVDPMFSVLYSIFEKEVNSLVKWDYAIKNYSVYIEMLKSNLIIENESNYILEKMNLNKFEIFELLNVLKKLYKLQKEVFINFINNKNVLDFADEIKLILKDLDKYNLFPDEKFHILEINGNYKIINSVGFFDWVSTRSTYRFIKSVMHKVLALSQEQKNELLDVYHTITMRPDGYIERLNRQLEWGNNKVKLAPFYGPKYIHPSYFNILKDGDVNNELDLPQNKNQSYVVNYINMLYS